MAAALGLFCASAVHADDYSDVNQLIRSGKFADASTRVDAYLATNPRDPQMRFLKGVVQTESGKQADAIATFTALTQEYPELPEPYNNLAVLYANDKQYDKARMALEMAIRTNPSYATAHENMGDVYAKLASQAYAKALQLDAGNTQVPTKLALIRDLFTPAAAKAKNSNVIVSSRTPAAAPVPTAAPSAAKAAPASASTSATLAAAPVPPAPTPSTATASAPAAEVPVAAPNPPVERAVEKPGAKTETAAGGSAMAPPAPGSAPADSDVQREVEAAVRTWAAAWSARDMKDYLAAYAKDFRPSGNQSRAAWESERRARIVNKKRIKVTVTDLSVKVQGEKATARFHQDYDADSLSASSIKTLQLQKTGGRWVIVSETTG